MEKAAQPELLTAPTGAYVRVVPEDGLDRAFDYVIPPALAGQVRRGQRVRVPLGRRTVRAYVVDFPSQPEVERCREMEAICDPEPYVPEGLMRLALWMADYYCSNLSAILKMMLPAAVREKEDGYQKRLWISVPEGLQADVVRLALARARAQWRAWEAVYQSGGGWMTELSLRCKATSAIWQALAQRGLIVISSERKERNPLAQSAAGSSRDLLLNAEQVAALDAILEETAHPQPRPVLLQGVTGSGKTEVYLQAMANVLARGRSALMLVPEISLTPQTIERFRARFEGEGVRVAVLHSHLSAGERHDQWQAIRNGQARLVIGARSALFAPLHGLGLIVVDEEHESGYKQDESPRYHARDAAVMRAHLEKIPIVLGSATPSLESVFNAQQGKYRLCRLTRRAEVLHLPQIDIVDMRKEKSTPGQPVLLSTPLREAIQQSLDHDEQVILFLNRRGFSTSLQCPQCGHVEECPHCAVPMTYHRTTQELRCHLCGHHRPVPARCPSCRFDAYRMAGSGTQRIEDAVSRAFPQARWSRMDSDSMRTKNAYARTLREFGEGRIDILIGTQMLAKGLHFPRVTCVGVISCDHALQLPDFRAAERVFQQLVQVAGRAGRGDRPGRVLIQTFTPHHDAIQFARHHDVDGFQQSEMEYRKAHGYPPYRRVALITFRGRQEDKVKFCVETAARRLREALAGKVEVPDPGPAPLARLRDAFRYQIFLLSDRMPALAAVLKKEILGVTWPEQVRAVVDIDPINLM